MGWGGSSSCFFRNKENSCLGICHSGQETHTEGLQTFGVGAWSFFPSLSSQGVVFLGTTTHTLLTHRVGGDLLIEKGWSGLRRAGMEQAVANMEACFVCGGEKGRDLKAELGVGGTEVIAPPQLTPTSQQVSNATCNQTSRSGVCNSFAAVNFFFIAPD